MSLADPELSIIIACFNDGPLLLEAVASAERSAPGRSEVIVVNDGSTDSETLRLLAEIEGRGHRVVHQANGGPAAARNAGIRAARGWCILPLDADNRLRPAYAERGLEILGADPALDVVYGDPEDFGERRGRRRIPEFDLARIALGNYIDTCAAFRKSLWERLGGYDDKIPVYGVEDWDFWMRAGLAGARFRRVDEALYEYRVRAVSVTTHAKQAANEAATLRYLRAKPIQITLGDYMDAADSWAPVIIQLRWRPLRGLAQLLVRAFLPRLFPLWLRLRKRPGSGGPVM